jgi:hypothetical protein
VRLQQKPDRKNTTEHEVNLARAQAIDGGLWNPRKLHKKDGKKTTIEPTMCMKIKETWTECPAKSRTFTSI